MARKRAMEQFKPRTPEALEGRKHIDVQTGQTLFLTSAEYSIQMHYQTAEVHIFLLCASFSDLYLEELSDVIVATDIECQTDAFLDRPATPLFIPAKSGKDVQTQIEEGEVGAPKGTVAQATLYTLKSLNITLITFQDDR